MGEYLELIKAVANLGTTGLLILVAWRLLDKWAGKFLAAQEAQAKAMSDLAGAVKEGQGEQREVLLAVRVLASKVDEVRDSIKDLVEVGNATERR